MCRGAGAEDATVYVRKCTCGCYISCPVAQLWYIDKKKYSVTDTCNMSNKNARETNISNVFYRRNYSNINDRLILKTTSNLIWTMTGYRLFPYVPTCVYSNFSHKSNNREDSVLRRKRLKKLVFLETAVHRHCHIDIDDMIDNYFSSLLCFIKTFPLNYPSIHS